MQAETPAADRSQILSTFKSLELIEIAFRDLGGLASFDDTVGRLSDLADRIIAVALEAAWKDAMSKNSGAVVERAGDGFAVIAFGKLGGQELNYSSDIDLLFCRRSSDDDLESRFFTRVGERLVHILSRAKPGGFLYRVDMRLRPHGETGPLVPTIENLENYYESWGEAWERQALIKARPICGDPNLCDRFRRFAEKFTFARQMDDSSLEEIKRVKHRAEREYACPADRFHVKQGPGGIRDIEFYVQYLQLVAGTRYPEVRAAATLNAIQALGMAKALLEGEEAQLSLAYVFLRNIEHRLQLRRMTPQAMIPDNRDDLELLARGMGFGRRDQPAAEEFLRILNSYRSRVRTILERIYLTRETSGRENEKKNLPAS